MRIGPGRRLSALPVLAIIVSLGMIVGAIGIMRLSNTIDYENTVELPVNLSILSTSATPGGDLPDYAEGDLLLGQIYDMQVQYVTSKALESGAIIVQFTGADIEPSDVRMSWTDSITWVEMAWMDSGEVLTGTLGYVGSQPAGETVSYFAKLSYETPGSYNFQVWVEGIVA